MVGARVLFILKKKAIYNEKSNGHIGLSTGLINSATFINDMLVYSNIQSNLIVVDDNNNIDRVVTKYNPTHVIIEALWVVPEKFDILRKLHPNVKWIIRFHSEIPFLSQEGNAMDWIFKYLGKTNVKLAFNSSLILDSIKKYIRITTGHSEYWVDKKILYLPNYYPEKFRVKTFHVQDEINISCFGAIRPLKNQLNQAMASIIFANIIRKKLVFHINGSRIEQNGDPVFKNLVKMFANSKHKLIIHPWSPREDFLKICRNIDIAMQCSFSETFNIVAADTLSQGIPLVSSNEVPWSSVIFNASPTDTNGLVNALLKTYKYPNINTVINKSKLTKYVQESKNLWLNYFKYC